MVIPEKTALFFFLKMPFLLFPGGDEGIRPQAFPIFCPGGRLLIC
jgi:hypothetical protein